jgi:hypothetical protein
MDLLGIFVLRFSCATLIIARELSLRKNDTIYETLGKKEYLLINKSNNSRLETENWI